LLYSSLDHSARYYLQLGGKPHGASMLRIKARIVKNAPLITK